MSLIAVNNIIVVTYCSKFHRLSLSLIAVNETPLMGLLLTTISDTFTITEKTRVKVRDAAQDRTGTTRTVVRSIHRTTTRVVKKIEPFSSIFCPFSSVLYRE